MFSIVIPLYNKQVSIQNTLDCALNQTFKDFEILVVDDGSLDNSYEIVKKNQLADSHIKLIKKENGGVSSARNEGIRCSTMKYIAFLDSDDIWEENYLEEQAKLIEKFPNAVLWGCALGIIENNKKRNGNQGDIPEGFRGLIPDYFGRKSKANLFSSSSVVINRSVFNIVGLFDERINFGEDLDMWFRIILQFPVAYFNKTLAYYNYDAENRAMNKKRPDLKTCLPYYIGKYKTLQVKSNSFVPYTHSFCAGYILPYYFGSNNERKLARHVISNLDFTAIRNKYTLFFKSPLLIGYIVYLIFNIKNRVQLQIFFKKPKHE